MSLGDWHQYDDIIRAKPQTGVVKYLKETIFGQQKTNLIQGRQIAGNIMLETIFDHLRNWSEINLKSFLIQLNQFFEIYSDPIVHEKKQTKQTSRGYGKEKKQMKWTCLGYGKDDVSLKPVASHKAWSVRW